MSVEVEDTYAEAFKGLYSEILVTARDRRWLTYAVNCATGYASSVVGCGCEAGVDVHLGRGETPDKRPGALLQFWVPAWGKEPEKDLESALLHRVGQCILTAPTASVYNATHAGDGFAVGRRLGFFGDGFQRREDRYGRGMVVVPTMMGEFLIEENLGFGRGVMGGNLWFMGDSGDAALSAAEKAVDEISRVRGVITSFPGGVCASGSGIGSRYNFLIASTNTRYCPTLRDAVEDSLVPEGVESISEVIINGLDVERVSAAMKAGAGAVGDVEGLIRVSAGNYGGRLGGYRIYLKR